MRNNKRGISRTKDGGGAANRLTNAKGVWPITSRHASARDPEEELEKAARADAVRTAVARLRDRERDIVTSHFGLDGESHTLEEIASDLHLAPERVRQIERHAFATLAERLDE